MAGSDKRKQSLYFPEDMLREIQDEATRQDRSLSWIVQKAWKIARKDIMKYPSVNEFPGEDDERGASAPRSTTGSPARSTAAACRCASPTASAATATCGSTCCRSWRPSARSPT